MSELKDVILGFSDLSQPADADLLPLLAHAYIENISAAKVHAYLTKKGVTVAARRVRDLRRKAGIWLGLGNPGKGRMSRVEKEELLEKWHQQHGYPTLEDLVNGWSPAMTNLHEKEAIRVTKSDNSQTSEESTTVTQPQTQSTTANSPAIEKPTQKETKRVPKKRSPKLGPPPPKINLDDFKEPEKEPLNVDVN